MSDVKPVAWMPDAVFEALVFETTVNACVSVVKLIPEDVPLYNKAAIDALQAEIEALRKDVERLEYLANDMQDMTFNGVEVLDFIEEDCDWPKAWRKAIDAAIAKEKQQESLK